MKKKYFAFAAAILTVLCVTGCFTDVEDMTETEALSYLVQASMDEYFLETDVKIESLILVHESGNRYSGVAKLRSGETVVSKNVDVVYDGENFKWEIKK